MSKGVDGTWPRLRNLVLRRFGSMLGWWGLQLNYIRLSDEESKRGNVPDGLVIYYMTTDSKFNLQINTTPCGQTRFHQATLKADRYGVVHVGWHPFELFDDDEQLELEARRLKPWLDRKNLRDPARRRSFLIHFAGDA